MNIDPSAPLARRVSESKDGRSAATGLKGNSCPKCGDGGGVLESRSIAASIGVVRRRRRCDSCDEDWTTFEVASEDLEELKTYLEQYSSFKARVDQMVEDLNGFDEARCAQDFPTN